MDEIIEYQNIIIFSPVNNNIKYLFKRLCNTEAIFKCNIFKNLKPIFFIILFNTKSFELIATYLKEKIPPFSYFFTLTFLTLNLHY